MSKRLVICPIASNDTTYRLYSSKPRSYDICLVNYDPENWTISDNSVDFIVNRKGYKFPNIHWLQDHMSLIEQYDYVWCTDYDVKISKESVEMLFTIAEQTGLDLCQPSLSHESHWSWPIVLNKPNSFVRHTNFVEIMCPLFSKAALEKVMWTFSEKISYSGWGLDFLWAKLLENKGIAIIDAVQITHQNIVTSQHWKLPDGNKPEQEMHRIIETYLDGIDYTPREL